MCQLFPTLGLLSGLCFFSLALWTATRRPLGKVRRLFIWLCGLFALWAFAFALHVANPDKNAAWFWYKIMTPAWTLIPAMIFHFCFLVARSRIPKWAASFAYGLGTLFLLRFLFIQPMPADLTATHWGWHEVHHGQNLWMVAYAAYATGSALLGMAVVFLWSVRSANANERKQARFILLGGVSTILIATTTNLVRPLTDVGDLPGLAPIVTPIWGLCIMLAISRYDLLNLNPQMAAPQILSTMADGLLLTGADGHIVHVNRAATHLLGRSSEDLHGLPLQSLFPGEELLEAEVLKRRLRQGPLLAHSISLSLKGSRIHLNLSASAILDKGNRQRGNVLLLRDITERKISEANLVKADRLASMGLLAAGVAHEINNPLTMVLYNVESLLEDMFPLEDQRCLQDITVGDAKERLEDALEGASRVRNIVQDLKIFSRMDEKPQREVQINRVVETSMQMAFNPIKYKARLIKELGQVGPVLADEGRLSQVFVNLLINAAQALDDSRRASNKIFVRSWQQEEQVLIQIQDTGIGIPEEQREHIFDAFFTTKPPGVGTGLGLSISLQIVKDYGGDIQVDSAPGQGSIFTVRLPCKRAA